MDATVSALFIYPVKSCRAFRVEHTVLDSRGLRYDRRWMIVDETGGFVTQRREPRLALISASIEGDALVLAAPGAYALRVVLASTSLASSRRTVRIWRDTVRAVDCGKEAATWLTRWLGFPASLVFMPEDERRRVNPEQGGPNDIVSFADGFPLLIASTSSLEELNALATTPVPMDRFRPNVVVRGCAPWAEDSWARIRLGSVRVRIAKPCERCGITTVDQKTAQIGVEPMRTLALFRKRGNAVVFAQNGLGDETGPLAVGDPLVVLELR